MDPAIEPMIDWRAQARRSDELIDLLITTLARAVAHYEALLEDYKKAIQHGPTPPAPAPDVPGVAAAYEDRSGNPRQSGMGGGSSPVAPDPGGLPPGLTLPPGHGAS